MLGGRTYVIAPALVEYLATTPPAQQGVEDAGRLEQLLDRLEPIAAIAGFKFPRVCTPEELMGISAYE